MAVAQAQTAFAPTQVKIVESQTFMERLNKLSERISRRAYEIFESRGKAFGHDREDWFEAECEILAPFELRIKEKEEALIVEAETPDFSAKELEISVEPWTLTICGSKEVKGEQKEGKAICQEQRSNDFLRVIDLPAKIEAGKATATLKNGLLEINLPKVPKLVTKCSI